MNGWHDEQIDAAAVRLLDRLERRESEALGWGFVESAFSREELLAHAGEILRKSGDGTDPAELIGRLEDRRMLFEPPFEPGRFRTRFAETVRLLFRLRQLLPGRPWDTAPSLVADYRLALRARRFPEFHLDPATVTAGADPPTDPVEQRSLEALLGVGEPTPRRLAGFQMRTLWDVRRALRSRGSHGTIITAGTGAGKTLAAYLPALTEIARNVRAGVYRTQMLCLYPRNELLKDQFAKVMRETGLLAAAEAAARPLRVGAFFQSTPASASFAPRTDGWLGGGGGLICPFLRCPRCGSDLIWRETDRNQNRERLDCRGCNEVLDNSRIVLTRASMAERPPDLLFTSVESLNRQLGSSRYRELFGAGLQADRTPRIVLLDEVHTYEGVPGAQAALLLRRWRHATRNQPVHWIGLSATLRNPVGFLAQLIGLPEERIRHHHPGGDEVEEGVEYQLAVRGDPASQRSLLSTSIQTAMLLGRVLDPSAQPGEAFEPPSRGLQGRRAFLFADDLDVINRLFHDLLDAESNPPRARKPPLAALRDPDARDPAERERAGQNWWMPARIGHRLAGPGLGVGRTTSQDRGLDGQAALVVCSAALEVGYDDDRVGAVLQHKAPHSMAGFLQRKGRAGRMRGMRPWTVVVLSDYGLDRLAYQAPEQLFDPTLPARHLPVRNRHVLRMQAVYAAMDWLAEQARDHDLRFGVWTALTEPAQPGTKLHEQQRWLADRIREVLDRPERTEELVCHLMDALGADRTEIDRLLWQSPRPLMTAVLPTALRRLATGWNAAGENADGREAIRPFNPLPEFVAGNLFSDLQLPEVGLTLPVRNGDPMIESMPLLQAMQSFAPGKVSRRFARDRTATLSHWVPITSEAEQEIALEVFCVAALDLGEWPLPVDSSGDQAPAAVRCLRPLHLNTTLCDERKIAVSSTSFLRWNSRLSAEHAGRLGRSLPLAAAGRWGTLQPTADIFTHAEFCPVSVRRYAHVADANLRLKGEDPIRCTVRLVAGPDRRPAALGFETTADGLRLRFRLPAGAPHTWLSPELLRTTRPLYFRHRIHSDPALSASANRFLLDWVAEIHLAALTALAADARVTLAEAADRLAAEYLVRTNEVMDDLLQLIDGDSDCDGGGDGRGDEPALRRQLSACLADAAFQARIRDCERILWQEPSAVQGLADWLRARFRTTLGQAFLEACLGAAERADAGDLCLDFDSGVTDPDAVQASTPDPDMAEIWITETSPGGCGIIEAIGRAVGGDPARIVSAWEEALGPGDFEVIDAQLERLVRELSDGTATAAAVAAVRVADDSCRTTVAMQGLMRTLSDAGYVPSRPFLVALNARIFAPAAGPERDGLLQLMLRQREEIEARLDVEIGAREFAYVAARNGEIRAAAERAAGRGLAGNDLYRVLVALLWPRASLIRATAATTYNPFSAAPPPDRLLAWAALHLDEDPVDASDPKWRQQLEARLEEAGRAVVRVSVTETRAVLAHLAVSPLQVGFIRVHPRLTGARREGPTLLLTLLIREANL